jgi:dimethylglycine dehydrogenase
MTQGAFVVGTWWKYALSEAKAIRNGVGVIDATAFTKHIVKGPGALSFLDWFHMQCTAKSWTY